MKVFLVILGITEVWEACSGTRLSFLPLLPLIFTSQMYLFFSRGWGLVAFVGQESRLPVEPMRRWVGILLLRAGRPSGFRPHEMSTALLRTPLDSSSPLRSSVLLCDVCVYTTSCRHAHVRDHVCARAHIVTCIYTYIQIYRERERERKKEREAERERESERNAE